MKVALSVLSSLVLTTPAFADPGRAPSETPPAVVADAPELVEGEVHVTLKNAEYVKVQVNGEETDNTEYEKAGKVVIIKGLKTDLERNAVTLLPAADSGLKPFDLDVQQKDFKKTRKGRFVFLVATKAVTFEKGSATPEPKPNDKPKEPEVAPPPPEKDDL